MMVFYQYMYQHCDWEYWIYLTQVKGFEGPNQGHMPGAPDVPWMPHYLKYLETNSGFKHVTSDPSPSAPAKKISYPPFNPVSHEGAGHNWENYQSTLQIWSC